MIRAEKRLLVPLAGIEPALLPKLDFETIASTNSATGAHAKLRVRWAPGFPCAFRCEPQPVANA